jgi:hypothetical protein
MGESSLCLTAHTRTSASHLGLHLFTHQEKMDRDSISEGCRRAGVLREGCRGARWTWGGAEGGPGKASVQRLSLQSAWLADSTGVQRPNWEVVDLGRGRGVSLADMWGCLGRGADTAVGLTWGLAWLLAAPGAYVLCLT